MEKNIAIDGLDAMELPEIEPKAPGKPRIHIGGDTCVSCEG